MTRKSVQVVVLALMLALVTAIPGGAVRVDEQSYIVVLQPGSSDVAAEAASLARVHGGQVGFVYQYALDGFSITASAAAAAALARNPRVAYVEPDTIHSIDLQTTPTGIKRIFADSNANIDIDASDDWRVDVDVAVIDTGVDLQHPDLNVMVGVDCAGGSPLRGSCKSGGDDDHYHGTHVAGTIGALDNSFGVVGVAPGARIWPVKVLNSQGSGYTSWIVAGIDWVAQNAATIEVANMSLGGSGFSQAEYDAIQGAVTAGVAFAVAAGNSDADARNYSPAAFDNVLTVSALADFDGAPGRLGSPTCRTDQDDTLADFSNWGPAVDIAAPGVCILSTYPIEQGEYGTISGTSMASPHAAGALALLASVKNPKDAIDVASLYSVLKRAGNFDWIDDSVDGIQEPLLNVSNTTLFAPRLVAGSSGGGGPVDTLPTVSITNPANDAIVFGIVSVTATASDDNGVTQVEFFVDGDSIGTGTDGWAAFWDTTVASEGVHTVSATATDTIGQTTTSASISVTVDNVAAAISLTVTPRKVKGSKYADIVWLKASGASVEIRRDGVVVATTANDGLHTDGPLGKGGGTTTYEVCETGTAAICSDVITVTW